MTDNNDSFENVSDEEMANAMAAEAKRGAAIAWASQGYDPSVCPECGAHVADPDAWAGLCGEHCYLNVFEDTRPPSVEDLF